MPIPVEHKNRCVYHFTNVENLPTILEHGLLSNNEIEKIGLEYKIIALSDIQKRRACMEVSCGCKGVVHDYVPVYFCKRSSMLLSLIQRKVADQQLIIYLEFPIDIMNQYPSVFSDASANTAVPPNFYADPSELKKLNWEAIDSLKWSMASDRLKQARMAELFVHKRIDTISISRIIVWSESIKEFVKKCYDEAGLKAPPVGFDRKHYFIDFLNTKKHSIVTGPYSIEKAYNEAVEYVLENIGKAASPRFKNLYDFRDALRKDLSCIPETAEIIDLESDNEMHSEDVGAHTLKVVEKLHDLAEYKNMNKTDKLLVDLGAFLHDIGKGPKSRWAHKEGRQQVDPDHPIKALPMVQRILTEDVGSIKRRSAKIICKLVCYHDLVGDIVGKGRRVEELEEIVEDERELDMIIALGKSDMISVEPIWQIMYGKAIVKLRESVITKLKSTD